MPPTRKAARSDVAPTPRRTDIDGLRALAIALVVGYHLWSMRVSGGVDVFLMISAYFLTLSFLRRAESDRPLALGDYWLGRFRRLLPAASVTIVATLVLIWQVFPASWWQELWQQSWASLFYFQNWQLAAAEVDYYARDTVVPSPLQHFWSLSVQGQVFVLWPILIALTLLITRRMAVRARTALIWLFAIVGAASFVYSVMITESNQAFAYFDTFARLWEFALGSLLALLTPWLRLPRVLAVIVGWVGLVALILCGLLLDVRGGFPGYLALWPTLAAAAVIIAGETVTRAGPAGFLSSWPLQRLATIAYALYLVHWPILIGWLVYTEQTTVSFAEGAVIIGFSLVLAVVLTFGIERPLQRSGAIGDSRWKSAAVIVLCVLLVAVPVLGWQALQERQSRIQALVTPNPGAAVIFDAFTGEPADDVPLVPPATLLDEEWVALDGACVGSLAPSDDVLEGSCLARQVEDAVRTVLVLGDSHAQQWMGALEPLVEEQSWDLVALLRGGCAFADDEWPQDDAEGCELWRDSAITYANRLQPDLIVMMGTKSTPETSNERALRGLDDTLKRLNVPGASIALVRDNPRFKEDMFLCVEQESDVSVCARDRADVLGDDDLLALFEGDGIGVLDLTDLLCINDVCPAVIGGVIAYLDDNHLTRTYARTMTPVYAERLAHITGW